MPLDDPIDFWGTDEVKEWLQESKLDKFVDVFLENEIDGSTLLGLDDEILRDDFEIAKKLDRTRILKKRDVLAKGEAKEEGEAARAEEEKAVRRMSSVSSVGGAGAMEWKPMVEPTIQDAKAANAAAAEESLARLQASYETDIAEFKPPAMIEAKIVIKTTDSTPSTAQAPSFPASDKFMPAKGIIAGTRGKCLLFKEIGSKAFSTLREVSRETTYIAKVTRTVHYENRHAIVNYCKQFPGEKMDFFEPRSGNGGGQDVIDGLLLSWDRGPATYTKADVDAAANEVVLFLKDRAAKEDEIFGGYLPHQCKAKWKSTYQCDIPAAIRSEYDWKGGWYPDPVQPWQDITATLQFRVNGDFATANGYDYFWTASNRAKAQRFIDANIAPSTVVTKDELGDCAPGEVDDSTHTFYSAANTRAAPSLAALDIWGYDFAAAGNAKTYEGDSVAMMKTGRALCKVCHYSHSGQMPQMDTSGDLDHTVHQQCSDNFLIYKRNMELHGKMKQLRADEKEDAQGCRWFVPAIFSTHGIETGLETFHEDSANYLVEKLGPLPSELFTCKLGDQQSDHLFNEDHTGEPNLPLGGLPVPTFKILEGTDGHDPSILNAKVADYFTKEKWHENKFAALKKGADGEVEGELTAEKDLHRVKATFQPYPAGDLADYSIGVDGESRRTNPATVQVCMTKSIGDMLKGLDSGSGVPWMYKGMNMNKFLEDCDRAEWMKGGTEPFKPQPWIEDQPVPDGPFMTHTEHGSRPSSYTLECELAPVVKMCMTCDGFEGNFNAWFYGENFDTVLLDQNPKPTEVCCCCCKSYKYADVRA